MTEVDGAARERPCADAVRLIPEATGDTEWRIREIRAVLDEADQSGACEGDGAYLGSQLDRIREILDSAPPAPRVFFPGDTVPGGVWVVSIWGARFMYANDWPVTVTGPLVETSRGVSLPPGEWQATVDRARDARVAELRAAMIEADRNYQPPPEPDPDADRWASARDTCPHGIVRGLITCPVCEPEKQAAAEASFRAVVDRGRAARAIPEPTEGGPK